MLLKVGLLRAVCGRLPICSFQVISLHTPYERLFIFRLFCDRDVARGAGDANAPLMFCRVPLPGSSHAAVEMLYAL